MRSLITRVKEHVKGNSEIFSHINSCTSFQHIVDLLNLPDALFDKKPIELYESVLANTHVLDSSNHWSVLLFKEALAIRRCKPLLNHGLKASKEFILFR